MTQNSAGGVGEIEAHSFELPAPPEGLTWSRIEDPFALKLGQFVLACQLTQSQATPKATDETAPHAQDAEYGRVAAVIKPQHPETAHQRGYIHLAPRNDRSSGVRVLPTTSVQRESHDRAGGVLTHIISSGYAFFRLRRRLSEADVPRVHVPDADTV
jgi:hypothetical protein